jgi:hypothetical protein
MKRILHVLRDAYRANLEEQDDPILWLIQCMQGAGADGAVLLSGTAVGYGVAAQDASGLAFGSHEQTQPPRIADDLQRMLEAGIPVHFVSEDAEERGITRDELIPSLEAVEREKVGDLLARFERVFAW